MNRSRTSQHALAGKLPEQKLAQRLLFHAPGIERAQRPDDIRDMTLTTSGCRGQASVIENCVDVNHVKFVDVGIKPGRQRLRILERLAPLVWEKDCGNALVISNFEFRISN